MIQQISVFLITHNCTSITHRLKFPHTDLRLVRHVDAYIFSATKMMNDESENKVHKAKPHLHNQIPSHNADWSKSHFWKFYSNADWSKSHFWKFYSNADWLQVYFLSPLSLQVCYHWLQNLISGENITVANDK